MSDKVVTIGGRQFELKIERDGKAYTSGPVTVEIVSIRPNEAEIRVGDRTFFVPFANEGNRISFVFDGETYLADLGESTRARVRHRDHSMEAPMPGVILKILVRPGDVVSKGAPLIVLEAMKMEHQIVAAHDGTVDAVLCREGELVQPGSDLVTVYR